MPPIYNFCKKKRFVESEWDNVIKYIQTNGLLALIALVGYIVIYRLVMWAYAELKAYDNKIWYDLHLPKTHLKESRKNLVCSSDKVDCVELSTIEENQKVPHSNTNEDILVGIHVKKQTKLESSAKSEKQDVDIPPSSDAHTPIPAEPMVLKERHGAQKSAMLV
ncbi:hypothetical protein KR074_009197 [Drosophila pseudoananassae]|nr:hypothetical protein KR074_009197 [Drosophila pseudoananassae]